MQFNDLETLALHAGYRPDATTGSRAVPLYQTTAYQFQNTEHAARLFHLEEFGNIYTRMMNPTTDVLEKRVAALEGGVAGLAVASGHSAILLGILNIANAGDDVVAASQLYGGTWNLFRHTLPKMGITVHFVDATRPESFREAITERTRLFFVESVGNPALTVPDLSEISRIGHEAGIPLMVDNTFPTPFLLRPIDSGADIVIHSATKYLGGHGTVMGGVIVDAGKFDWSQGRHPMMTDPDPSYHGLKYWEVFGSFEPFGGANIAYIIKARVQGLRDLGPAISPANSWQILQGIETLHLRMERHSENALRIAKFLESHPGVEWVLYPGLESHPDHKLARRQFTRGLFGGMLGFGIKGGMDAGKNFINRLELFSHVANVGDARSLAIHPASTTHSQLTPEDRKKAGAGDDFIRLSIGLESAADLERDLDQAITGKEEG